jgi:hypothetical protein
MHSSRRPGSVHIDNKITAQLAARGWTVQQINEVTNRPPIGVSIDSTAGNPEPATLYGSRIGGYVVVNDRTGRVVQISDKNDPNWIADGRIVWI